MSVVKYPERISSKDVQIWHNAALDNGVDSETPTGIKVSWSNLESVLSFDRFYRSFESDCAKENLSPSLVDFQNPVFAKDPVSVKALQINNVVANAGLMSGLKKNQESVSRDCVWSGNGVVEERNLDFEIEEIEKEISKLSTRLESLRFENVKRNVKVVEKRGRIMGAKLMDSPKKGLRSSDEEMKGEESMNGSEKLRTPRRGVSLGPAEIMRGMRRGISVGPMEIFSATKMKNLGKQDVTPIQSSADRRKSCYWKLQNIDELRVTKERGKSMSLSPKSRSKTFTKPQIPKQAVTTIGARKMVKKEDEVISSIQPKKLFVKDGEKLVPSKKPLKSGRVVPSRYNRITSGGSTALTEFRKRSWPENEEEIKRSENKHVSLAAKSEGVERNVDHSRTPLSVTKVLDVVPKIKTSCCTIESPRDSGPAKRVSELVGKKSFFSTDDEGENPNDESACQALSFEEEDITKEYPKIRVLRCFNDSPRDSGAAKRVSQLVGRKPFFAAADDDNDNDIPDFSFEEDAEEN